MPTKRKTSNSKKAASKPPSAAHDDAQEPTKMGQRKSARLSKGEREGKVILIEKQGRFLFGSVLYVACGATRTIHTRTSSSVCMTERRYDIEAPATLVDCAY